jgi:hypothetical protein
MYLPDGTEPQSFWLEMQITASQLMFGPLVAYSLNFSQEGLCSLEIQIMRLSGKFFRLSLAMICQNSLKILLIITNFSKEHLFL